MAPKHRRCRDAAGAKAAALEEADVETAARAARRDAAVRADAANMAGMGERYEWRLDSLGECGYFE